jgi:hypothetical protein
MAIAGIQEKQVGKTSTSHIYDRLSIRQPRTIVQQTICRTPRYVWRLTSCARVSSCLLLDSSPLLRPTLALDTAGVWSVLLKWLELMMQMIDFAACESSSDTRS